MSSGLSENEPSPAISEAGLSAEGYASVRALEDGKRLVCNHLDAIDGNSGSPKAMT
jgi:hypothetical protein